MDNKTKKQLVSLRNELVGVKISMAAYLERLENALQTADTDETEWEKYEAMRQKDILTRLEKNITSRDININTVVEWAQIPEISIRTRLYARNAKRTSTFWAVDVMRFLCDLWEATPPEAYYRACNRMGINPTTGNYELNRKTA
ncbi:MAG: hypothetical protein II939_14655 [Bacteroidales bacterium]|nr:hypothetical protein [Bacteroidales bacterium]